MEQQPPHICFYSNACKWSTAFIQELAKTPWKREFHYICVDPGRRPPNWQPPGWLKQTPTLVIRGEKEPRVDGEVMNWLYERRQREATASVPAPQARQDPAAAVEPEAWNMLELGSGLGSGDSVYSFYGSDTSTNGDGGASLPGTFAFLSGQAAPGQKLPDMYPGNSGSDKKTKREQMFDSQMEEYMKNRDNGLPKGPART
jgi:hypothetical protein